MAAGGSPIPLLFIMMMHEILVGADRTIGFEFGGRTVDCLAYADDVIVFTESSGSLQSKLYLLDAANGNDCQRVHL